MKFDLSRFKKIKQDNHSTTLKHPEGHTITIAHQSLNPKMKAAFAALPMHKEEGGEVEEKQPKAKETPKADPDQGKDKYKEFEKGATKSGYQPKDWLKNLKEGLGMAEGGIAGEEDQVKEPSQWEKFKTAFAPPEMGYDQGKSKEYRNEFVQEMPGAVAGSVAPVEGAAEDLINPIIKKLQTAPETLTPAEHQMLMDKLASIKPSAEVPAAVEGASEASKATPVQMIEPTATKPAMRTPEIVRAEMNAAFEKAGNKPTPEYGRLRDELNTLTNRKKGTLYAKGGKVQNFADGSQDGPVAEKIDEPIQDVELPEKAPAQQQAPVIVNVGSSASAPIPAPSNLSPTAPSSLTPTPQPQGEVQDVTQLSRANEEAGVKGVPGKLENRPTVQPQQQPPQVPQPGQPDPYGYGSYYRSLTEGLQEQQAGISDEARYTAMQAQALSNLAEEKAKKEAAFQGLAGKNLTEYNKVYDNWTKAIADQKLDANRYLGHMSTSNKIANALGLIIGGVGAGEGPNPVMDFINKQIDRDIDMQKAQLGQKQTLLDANFKHFGDLRSAMLMSRAQMLGYYAAKAEQDQYKYGGPIAQARAQAAIGLLKRQAAGEVQQAAMRQTMMQGGANGLVSPENFINGMFQGEEKKRIQAEFARAQQDMKARDNVLNAFDQISKLGWLKAVPGTEAYKLRQALIGGTLPGLSVETARRFTAEDAKFLKSLLNTRWLASRDEIATQRQALVRLLGEKLNFPALTFGNVRLDKQIPTMYDQSGNLRQHEGPPKTPVR